MAGHLEVAKANQTGLILKVQNFVNSMNLENMASFSRYEIDGRTWMKLTDRLEYNDEYVLTLSPWTFRFDDGEVCEGAIAEIHLADDMSINKIYMVM